MPRSSRSWWPPNPPAWCGAVSWSMAFCTRRLTCSCWASLQPVDVRLDVQRLVLPGAEELDRRIDHPGALHGVGGLGLGDPGCGDRPLRAALELDPEVQPAAQDDGDDPEPDDERRDGEPELATADEVEARLAPVHAGDRAVAASGLGQQRARRDVDRDELVLVELAEVDALLELLDLLLAHLVEGADVVVVVVLAVAAAVAHDPPPAAAPAMPPAPTGAGPWGPAPRPVEMLNAPEPWSRSLCPRRITSGRV